MIWPSFYSNINFLRQNQETQLTIVDTCEHLELRLQDWDAEWEK